MNYFRFDLYCDFSILPTLIENKALLIDLRPAYLFASYSIPGFINLPYTIFYNYLPSFDKQKPLYLLCSSGKVSKEVAYDLVSKGYLAHSFIGGIALYNQKFDPKLF